MSLAAGQAVAETACKDSPLVVDQCYVTHGRLFMANGTPSMRIWKVGTKRILGVVGPDGEEDGGVKLPDAIEAIEAKSRHPERAFWTRIYGDYLVCPLTKERPGWMQMVCIESATKLVAENLKLDDE